MALSQLEVLAHMTQVSNQDAEAERERERQAQAKAEAMEQAKEVRARFASGARSTTQQLQPS